MDRIYQVIVTVSPFTPQSAPLINTIVLEDAFLVSVEVVIPGGHAGLTGIRIRQSRQQILPWGSSGFLTADNYSRVFPVNTEIGSRSISYAAYNDDTYVHSFHLRFHLQDIDRNQQEAPFASAAPLAGLINDGFTSDTPLPPLPPIPLPPAPPIP